MDQRQEMHGMMPGLTELPPDEGVNQAVVDRYMQALSTGDLGAIGELFADDVEIEWPQSGEHFRGKQTCLNVFANYPGGSPKLVEVRRITTEGDLAVGETVLDYPDGKRYQAVAIVQLRNGKVVHETDYFAEPFPVPEWRIQYSTRG
jgi:ketosteroid isomerase-like protein